MLNPSLLKDFLDEFKRLVESVRHIELEMHRIRAALVCTNPEHNDDHALHVRLTGHR